MTTTKLIDLDFADKNDWLAITDLENMFSIYANGKQQLKYNLNQTLYLNIDESTKKIYKLKHDMYWPLISYKLYGTTHLAWLLMKVNNVPAKYIFSKIKAGANVKYIDTELVHSIVQTINK